MDENSLLHFDSEQAAFEWLLELINDPCVDNHRFAFSDDAEAVAKYNEQADSGCCGSTDYTIMVNGRMAEIGCNYGH